MDNAKNRLVLVAVAAVAVLLATSASAGNRGASFTGIGFIEDPGPFPASIVYSMNPQGTEFMVSPAFFGNYCVKWTREGGWGEEIGASEGLCFLSENGTIMGTGLFPGSDPPYLWPGTWAGAVDLWDPIPADPDFEWCGFSGLSMFDMGGNGEYATGLTWAGCTAPRAFLWDKATNTTVNLGSPNGQASRGNAVSDDGEIVAGWAAMLGGSWRGARWDNGTASWVDGQGNIDPKACVGTGKSCTYSDPDPEYGCPEDYVDDSSCQDAGTCVAGVCVGGINAGGDCEYYWDCPGECVGGPSAGSPCTDDWSCPDTDVCLPNPMWSDDAYKGEALVISGSGHVVGSNYGYGWPAWTSAWRQNPNGSFTEIPTLPTFPDTWNPTGVSDDGKTVVGYVGNPFFGAVPAFWIEGLGSVDLQAFLIGQGLDELYFWYLTRLTSVSADGTVMGGVGYNPDFLQEGFIVDLSKVWVCHAPAGDPSKARTLGVGFESLADHAAHGDFIGTCDFLNSGGLARVAELREQLREENAPARTSRQAGLRPDSNPWIIEESPESVNDSLDRSPRIGTSDKSLRRDETGRRTSASGRSR